jgi:hypothetical protein
MFKARFAGTHYHLHGYRVKNATSSSDVTTTPATLRVTLETIFEKKGAL